MVDLYTLSKKDIKGNLWDQGRDHVSVQISKKKKMPRASEKSRCERTVSNSRRKSEGRRWGNFKGSCITKDHAPRDKRCSVGGPDKNYKKSSTTGRYGAKERSEKSNPK